MTDQTRSDQRSPGGWVRLLWNPTSGIELVSGDSAGILGIRARRLIDAQDPLVLLPPEVSGILSGGVPETPVQVNASTFSGTVSPSEGMADLILFENRDIREAGGIILDELGAGVIGTDGAGVITQWNRAMSTIFRIPERHAVGRRLQDVLVQPILYSWDNVIQMVLDGRQVRVECRPEGQRRVESTFAPGGPGVVGTCFDTTESFQAERRLRTSRRMNQAYFHAVSTGLVLFDRDYRILVANRAFGRMFGLVENLLGIHLHEILPRESFAVLEDQTLPVFDDQEKREGSPRVVRFVLPDGTSKIISQSVSSIVEDSGEIHYAVGIFEDSTRAVLTEEELRACRERVGMLSTLSEVLVDGQRSNLNRAAEVLRETFSARAVAIYLFDPLIERELSARAGDWPDSIPETFSDLRIASFPLDSMQGCQLSGEEMGILGSTFSSCLVYPLEIERKICGYLIAADADDAARNEMYSLAGLATYILALFINVDTSESEKEQMSLLLDRQSRMADAIISTLDVPAALFRADWSVIFWNRAMEQLTGIPREAAVNRGELAANLLFDAIGGISTAQRLARKGLTEFPETWDVTDIEGEVTTCSWRLSGTESAERGSVEPVMILAGTEVGDIYSMQAAREAADMYKALSHGTTGILSATNRSSVMETVASTFLQTSGASRIDLDMRGCERISRSAHDQPGETVQLAKWKLTLETDTIEIGECVFQGGRCTPAMREFASNAARTYAMMERNAIGQRFAKLADRATGRFLITDSSGRILLSTWMEATQGAISGMNLSDVFKDPAGNLLENMIESGLKSGRLDMMLTMHSGDELRVASVAINGHHGVPLMFWWPITSETYVTRMLCGDTAKQTGIGLSDLLDQLSTSIARGFVRIRETLNPDHPVSATLSTAGYAFDTIGRAIFYQRLLRRAWSHVPVRIPSDGFLDAVSSGILEEGIQPPDLTVSGTLPDVSGDFDLLTDIILGICRIFAPTRAPRISVSEVTATDIRGGDGIEKGNDSYLCLELRGSEGATLPGISTILSEETIDISGGLNPAIELSILALSIRLAGGAVRAGEDPNIISILLPCVG